MYLFLSKKLLFCILASITPLSVGVPQSVGVKGQVLCKGQPAVRVPLKLYDENQIVYWEALLDATFSSGNGSFTLRGTVDDEYFIEPKLRIYHNCDDQQLCQRKVTIEIPDDFISFDTEVKEYYMLGKIELQNEWENETRECIYKNT